MRALRPGWWFDAALLAGFAAVTAALAWRTPLLQLDLAIRSFADAHRPGWFDTTLRWGNKLGQGGMVLTPLGAIVAFFMARARHTVRPFLPVIGAVVLTYIAIGPLKLWTHRLAPSAYFDAHPELLFHAPNGISYPSGHVVNTVVWYGVLAVLLTGVVSQRSIVAIRTVVPAIVVFTTTYLSFHWFSDGVGGVLIGVFVDRIMLRFRWDAIPLGRRLERSGWAGPFFTPAPVTPRSKTPV